MGELRFEWIVERVNEEDAREWGVVCLNYGGNGVGKCLERV